MFEFYAHVVPNTDTPLLMSMQDLSGLGYELRTGSCTLWSRNREEKDSRDDTVGPHHLLKDERGRCILTWAYETEALFTDGEIRKFHRSDGHQPSDVVMSALKEAVYHDLPQGTKQDLNDIASRCDPCQRHRQKPRHFTISVKWQGIRYNFVLMVELHISRTKMLFTCWTQRRDSMRQGSLQVESIPQRNRYGL